MIQNRVHYSKSARKYDQNIQIMTKYTHITIYVRENLTLEESGHASHIHNRPCFKILGVNGGGKLSKKWMAQKSKWYTQQALRDQLETSSFRSLWESFRDKIERIWRFTRSWYISLIGFSDQFYCFTLPTKTHQNIMGMLVSPQLPRLGITIWKIFASFRPYTCPVGGGTALLNHWCPGLLFITVGVWNCTEQDPEKLS